MGAELVFVARGDDQVFCGARFHIAIERELPQQGSQFQGLIVS